MEGETSAPDLILTGTIVYRRLFKRILFYDAWLDNGQDTFDCIELIARLDELKSLEGLLAVRTELGLGDRVEARGKLDEHGSLLISQVKVLERWKKSHPRETYFPPPEVMLPRRNKVLAGGGRLGLPGAPTSGRQRAAEGTEEGGAGGAASGATQRSPSALAQPAAEPSGRPRVLAGSEPAVNICRFFLNTGRCTKGLLCPNVHVQTGAMHEVRTAWIKRRKEQRMEGAAAMGFHVFGREGTVQGDGALSEQEHQQQQAAEHSGGAAAKGRRAIVLAAWLVETFGKEFLNSGSGVMDVAGGQGRLTYELQVVHRVKCTLVEPRPFKLNRFQMKQLKKGLGDGMGEQPGDPQGRQQQQIQQEQPLQEELQSEEEPHQRQLHLQLERLESQQAELGMGRSAVENAGGENEDSSSDISSSYQWDLVDNPFPSSTWADSGSSAAAKVSRPEDAFSQIRGHFDASMWAEGAPNADQLRACSVVVGLHPDQATETILEFAVQQRKAFAIAPCCVFPRLFPHRRLRLGVAAPGVGPPPLDDALEAEAAVSAALAVATLGSHLGNGPSHTAPVAVDGWRNRGDGLAVSTYSELVSYLLQEGGDGAHEAILPFEGANRVVYRHGPEVVICEQ